MNTFLRISTSMQSFRSLYHDMCPHLSSLSSKTPALTDGYDSRTLATASNGRRWTTTRLNRTATLKELRYSSPIHLKNGFVMLLYMKSCPKNIVQTGILECGDEIVNGKQLDLGRTCSTTGHAHGEVAGSRSDGRF